MSSYRLGRYAEAITWAEKSLNSTQTYASPQACAVLSMANWQLGRREEARYMLVKGEALETDLTPGSGVSKFGDWWIDWLITRVELNEAKALVQSQISEERLDKP
jgi:tetratricopeptide (TPR) repeat protein